MVQCIVKTGSDNFGEVEQNFLFCLRKNDSHCTAYRTIVLYGVGCKLLYRRLPRTRKCPPVAVASRGCPPGPGGPTKLDLIISYAVAIGTTCRVKEASRKKGITFSYRWTAVGG